MKNKKKQKKFTISQDQLRKMERAEERKLRLEQGEYRPSVQHKTSKKDEDRRQSNNIDPKEHDE